MEKINYDINSGLYKLPNYYGFVENTEVFFTGEKVYLTVENTGKIVFTNADGKQLAETFVMPDTHNNKHDNAWCKAEDGKIHLFLPVVAYEDNYPHCDGEYDRWSEVYIGYNCVTFNPDDGTLEKSELKSIE